MGQRTSKRSKHRLLNKMWRSSLALFRAVLKILEEFIKHVAIHILLEICLIVTPLVFVNLLTGWGIASTVAWAIAIVATIAFWILIAAVLTIIGSILNRSSESPKLARSRKEIPLARRIAQILSDKSSPEWIEYQDWLHDILLARRQLINNGSPRWKVTLITHWRLIAFCTVVTVNKTKRATSKILKIR